MIPIRLEWQRPRDGVEVVNSGNGAVARARSDRMEAATYAIDNLENPIALHLINCRDDDDLVAFLARFGMLENYANGSSAPDSEHMAILRSVRDDLDDVLVLGTTDQNEAVQRTDELLRFTTLQPALEFSGSRAGPRVGIQARSLGDFMAMEVAFALEAGAALTRCEHCAKAFLTGPLTGRRSHAVYCSDRCRVAAMRARNATKGSR